MNDEKDKSTSWSETTPNDSPRSKERSKNYLEQVRSAESPHLKKLQALLDEDWTDEPNTQTHIYIGGKATPSSNSLAPKAKEIVDSKLTKIVAGVVVGILTVIQTLRELGVFK